MDIGNVSSLTIACMAISGVLSVFVPIVAVIVLGVRKRMNWKALMLGILLFIAFAGILEGLLHRLVMGADPTSSALYRNTWLYMLYAGFAAGIFEETARLIGFRFMIGVTENESIDTGISYGLGHGGIESLIVGGLLSMNNLLASYMLNSGLFGTIGETLSGAELEELNESLRKLVETPSYMFLMTGIERLIALVLQVALSLLVLKAVSGKKWQYFIYAILIHAGIDMIAVLHVKGVITSVFLTEGILAVTTAAVAVFALRAFRAEAGSQP